MNADTEGVKSEFILSNYLCYAMQKMSVEIIKDLICITYIHAGQCKQLVLTVI